MGNQTDSCLENMYRDYRITCFNLKKQIVVENDLVILNMCIPMFLAYCCVCDINPVILKSNVYYIKSKMAATYLLINSNCISKGQFRAYLLPYWI